MAQEPPPTPPEDQQQEKNVTPADQVQPVIEQVAPIPAGYGEAPRSLGLQTFTGDVFRSARNHWGFSVAAYEAYSTDVSTSSQPRQDSGITAFLPRGFFNLGGRKSSFHLELGTGYRLYNHQEDLNGWDYYGNAEYYYRFSRNSSFQVSNQFRSSYNDSWSFMSVYSPLSATRQNSSSEVLFNRQRVTTNTLKGEFSYQLGRKAQFGVFGGYDYYKYTEDTLTNSRGSAVGGEFGYRLAKWLTFSTTYTHYLSNADESNHDAQIHELRIGNFDFSLSRNWRLWMGGGVEFADYQNDTRLTESADAGIEYASRNTSLSFRFVHGFTSAIGLAILMKTDNVTAEIAHRITSWARTWLQSYYYRSTDQTSSGLLKTYAGGGGFEFALRRDLFLTMAGFLQNQREFNTPVYGLGLNRITAYAGLQYVWPSRRRGDYEGSPSFGIPSLDRARGQ